MVKLSRFAHTFDLGDYVALYHSLRMKPVYLSKAAYVSLQAWLASSFCDSIDSIPNDDFKNTVGELARYKILTQTEEEDAKVLNFVRSKIPSPKISVCYLILSEQCNLACKYCFLGNNDQKKRANFLLENMSAETSDRAIDFFIRQIEETHFDYEHNKPILIFYGGEPLVNYSVLEHVAVRINELRKTKKCIKDIEMSVITNGLLLNEERIRRLSELRVGIAISIDGFTEAANRLRVDTFGKPVFPQILRILDLCKTINAEVSLSVTLSEETIKNPADILALIDTYGIASFGFNIIMSNDAFRLRDNYYEEATQFLIDVFVELRKRGIYEDRIMRKLKSFSKAQVYFSDCAATSGSQIVVAPNGQVGICHGCLYDKNYFVSDIYDDDFLASKNSTFIEWSQLTPINRDECMDCPVLGICGGGCPVNAMNSKPSNTIHSVDDHFCVHAKKTLDFLIHDLFRIILKNQTTDI